MGYLKYPIREMIFWMKVEGSFLYEEALNLPIDEFKWFFNRLEKYKEDSNKK